MQNLKILKYLAMVVTSVFIVGYELFRHGFLMKEFPKETDLIFSSLVFIVLSILFSNYMFHLIEKAKQAQLRQEREAKSLFDNSIDGIFVFDSSWKLADMNHGAEKMSGWQKKEVEDKLAFSSIFQLEPSFEFADFMHEIHSSMKFEKSLLIAKGNKSIPVSVTFTRIEDDLKENTKVAAIVRDLTERKQMEDVIKGLYTEASQKQLEAETQYRIAKKIASVQNLTTDTKQSTCEVVVKDIHKLLVTDFVGLILFDFDQQAFELTAITNSYKRDLVTQRFVMFREKHEFEANLSEKVSFVPLQNDDLILGYLVLGLPKETVWSINQQELLKSIVQILSISIGNVTLYHRLKDIAILEERERLAREMHDGLAQVISSIHMKVEVLKNVTLLKDAVCCYDIQEVLEELNQITEHAYSEVRQNLFNLRTQVDFDEPFVNFLQNYILYFQDQNQIPVHFEMKQMVRFSENTKMQLVRILQEVLSNVRRHSKATEVRIRLSEPQNGKCTFIFEDSGIGFDPERIDMVRHYGLRTMKERAMLVQGNLEVEAAPNRGTTVILTVPVRRGSYA